MSAACLEQHCKYTIFFSIVVHCELIFFAKIGVFSAFSAFHSVPSSKYEVFLVEILAFCVLVGFVSVSLQHGTEIT